MSVKSLFLFSLRSLRGDTFGWGWRLQPFDTVLAFDLGGPYFNDGEIQVKGTIGGDQPIERFSAKIVWTDTQEGELNRQEASISIDQVSPPHIALCRNPFDTTID